MITPHSAICARFYALPKIHKINNPLRPIVSNIGTATYPLSKFLASIFSPLCSTNSHTIKNSYDFVNKLGTLNFVKCSMLFLDVKSLFTNVPLLLLSLVTDINSCLCNQLQKINLKSTWYWMSGRNYTSVTLLLTCFRK